MRWKGSDRTTSRRHQRAQVRELDQAVLPVSERVTTAVAHRPGDHDANWVLRA